VPDFVVGELDQAPQEQLVSDHPSCRSALADQIWLVRQTGAFRLMIGLGHDILASQPLTRAEIIL